MPYSDTGAYLTCTFLSTQQSKLSDIRTSGIESRQRTDDNRR